MLSSSFLLCRLLKSPVCTTNIHFVGNKAGVLVLKVFCFKWWGLPEWIGAGWGGGACPPSRSLALLLQLTFNRIWFKKLVNNSCGAVVCRSLGHYGLFLVHLREDVFMCMCVCVWVFVGGGGGARHRGFTRMSSQSVSLSPCSFSVHVGGHRMKPPTPSDMTHKSFPLGNKGIMGETD